MEEKSQRHYSTQDFAMALNDSLIMSNPAIHAQLQNRPMPSSMVSEDIPDEEAPILKLFTAIIERGLSSLHGVPKKAKVVVIGAGPAGLCAAYELKRAGMDVIVLEISHRVGGRVKTIREPFASGLHGEGGAMRLPHNHILVHTYLKHFQMEDQLERFEQANKIIYIAGYGKTLTYDEFNALLLKKDEKLLSLFPNLKPNERGKTIDTLWDEAIQPVVDEFNKIYAGNPAKIREAYAHITRLFDKYSLQTYFEQVANWSPDCILLYDLGSAHVVLSNAFIESWKDAFLSSQSGGEEAKMQQMGQGMEQIPQAFLNPSHDPKLQDDIRYGAKVTTVTRLPDGKPGERVEVMYETEAGQFIREKADFVIFAVPFTALRLLTTHPSFSADKENAIRELRYVEVTKILLQFKTRWWEKYLSDKGQGTDGGMVTDLPIRYLMFPAKGSQQFSNDQNRGVVMASYTFEQDATELGALPIRDRIKIAADNMATIFGQEIIRENLELGAAQVWPADPLTGGSAFAYFAPNQKTRLFPIIIKPEWDDIAHFAGEHGSYSHGWIEGAFESGLRVAYQIYEAQIGTKYRPS
jgi:L-amino-acid oxidase